MLSAQFKSAQNFILLNARLLDRRLLACLFAGDSPRAVVDALRAYRNDDGGFGHALEPDKRCPESQPVDVEVALQTLDQVGLLGDSRVQQDLVRPALDFLATHSTPEGGVPFALPSVNRYPHAPWWTVADQPPASINPTADIAGLLLKHGIRHPWLDGAVEFCWRAIESTQTDAYHDLMPAISFLEHAPDHERAQRQLERLTERVRRPGAVEYDPQAGGYVKMPLDWAPAPQSYLRRLFDDAILARHLAALAARQRPDGGWPISWDPISPAVELEWRGHVTVQALLTLQAYEAAGLGEKP